MLGTRSAVRKGLGSLDPGDGLGSLGQAAYAFEESGAPAAHHYPALSDWPAVRPAGPEPLDPGEAPMGMFDLSRNEKRLAFLAAGGAALWYFVLRKKRKRRARR